MRLCYGQLRDPSFGQAFHKVSSFPGYEKPATMILVAKVAKKMREEAEVCDQTFTTLVKRFALLDSAGELLPMENTKGTYQIDPAKQKEWEAALKEFNAHELDLGGGMIRFEEVQKAGLSPLQLSYLDTLVCYPLEEVAPPA